MFFLGLFSLVASALGYASMLRNYRCGENLRPGMMVMSYPAVSDERRIRVLRAADNSVLECGVGQYTPGETLLVQLGPFDSDAATGYAEHLLELRSTDAGVFAEGGCHGRRAAGQMLISQTGDVDQSSASIETPADATAPIVLVAAWQRTMGPVRVTAECVISSTSAAPASRVPRPSPSPVPKSEL